MSFQLAQIVYGRINEVTDYVLARILLNAANEHKNAPLRPHVA